MITETLDILSLALLIGIVGLFIFLTGIGLGKLFDTTQKIHRRGLDRPLNLSLNEQFFVYFHNPDISIPITFAFFGGLMVIASIVLAIIGLVQKFLA